MLTLSRDEERQPDATRPGAEPTTAPNERSAGKQALRGMSFEDGENALKPAKDAHGSATVVGSAQTHELANDAAFTPELTRMLEANPRASLDQALQTLASAPGGVRGAATQHATAAAIGDQAARAAGGGTKIAALVANSQYLDPNMPDLAAPRSDAAGLSSVLAGRGYATTVRENLTASEMRTTFATAALGSGAKAGDHVVLHYGGHGLRTGLAGVKLDGLNLGLAELREADALTHSDGDAGSKDGAEAKTDSAAIKPASKHLKAHKRVVPGLDPTDYLATATVDGLARAAVGKGVHVTMILDACHAGAAADAVHEERDYPAASAGAPASEAAAPTTTPSDPAALVDAAVAQIRAAKAGLDGMVASWEADDTAVMLGDAWDADHKKSLRAEVAARHMAVIAQLWKEFLLPRVSEALQSVASLASAPFRPAPPLAEAPPAGTKVGVACAPNFEWLDEMREGVRGLASAKPPSAA